MRRVLVVGCGNPEAGDDAAGILAVRDARGRLERIAGVRVVEGAVGPDLSQILEDADAALIVDAVRTPGGGRDPGTLVRVEAGSEGLPPGGATPLSSHGFGVAEAVGLAAALGDRTPVVLLGVEAADVTVGTTPTPAVRRALPALAREIVREATKLAQDEAR